MQALSQLSYSPTRRRMLQQRGAVARQGFGQIAPIGSRAVPRSAEAGRRDRVPRRPILSYDLPRPGAGVALTFHR